MTDIPNAQPDTRAETLMDAPAGATDAAPVLMAGYDSVCFSRIDERIDLPRNYHLPTDRSGNLSYEEIVDTVDFAECLTRRIVGES